VKKFIILFVLFVAGVAFAEDVQTTKVFLIRHAPTVDDGTRDRSLSAAGEAQAARWAAVFASEAIDMIYSTDYKRTQATAQAIAASQGDLAITSYDANALDIEQLMSEIDGKIVVIVGHSNTTPLVANGFLGEEKYAQFGHDEYGTVIVVQYSGKAPASAAMLHID